MLLNFSKIVPTTKAAGAGTRTTVRRFTLGNVPSLEEGCGDGSGCVKWKVLFSGFRTQKF